MTVPPQVSRRRRRWVHTPPQATMRCFTDDELRRGIAEVIDANPLAFNDSVDWLPLFLRAAHPGTQSRRCETCGRQLTDAGGTALVALSVCEGHWHCAADTPPG